MSKEKRCADCRDGEHPNYDDNVDMVTVKDPESKKIIKRSYMCNEHVFMYLDDGYEVKLVG